jgi:Carboxypeptidase regulatory-like domain
MKLRQIAIAVVFCLFSVLAVGQRETGTINGTVTDTTGAVVPNSKITVISATTGAVRTATASQTGLYSVTDLQPGPYEVSVEGPGFSTYKGKVEVTVGSINTFNAVLKVGSKTETVEVTADLAASRVNVESQTISNTITAREVIDLPSLTRNIYDFVATSGNVSEGAYQMAGGLTARGAGVSINGQRAASTDLLLDGSENVDLFASIPGQNVPLDSVQEFSVLTSNFTAEYGRAGGGVINVATKSGSNDLHGTAYEYNRVSALASNTPDNNANGVKQPVFTRNQFGYSVGGPVKKDKLFFFSSTEWTRIRSADQEIRYVPDPAFIAASSANTQAFFSSFGKLRGNLVPLGKLTASQVATQIGATGAFATYAVANPNAPVLDQVSYTVPSDAGAGTPQNTYSMVQRADYNLSSNTSFYLRYGYSNENDFTGTNNQSPYAGYDTGAAQKNHNALISMTHLFSPTLVSDTKLVYNRFFNFQPLGAAPVSPTLYLTGTTPATINGHLLDFPGYSAEAPGTALPFGGPQNLYQFSQDVSWTRGQHQFRFGGVYIQMRDNRTFGAFETAVEDLSSGAGQAKGLNNFMGGVLNDFQAAVNPQGKFPCARNLTTGAITTDPALLAACTVTLPVGPPAFNRNNRFNDGSMYAQDSWKLRRHLTLNAGVRWEYFGVQHNADPNLDSNFYFASANNFFDQIRNGSMQLAPKSSKGELWNPSSKFAPRLGFAWDPLGDGKTSVRGGYGISYERNFGNVTFNVIQNPPNYFVLAVTPADLGAPIPITNNNAGPLAGSGSKALPRSTGRIVDPNIPTAYAEFWSLAAEHEVAKNTLFALEYTGSRGVHLYDISNINQSGTGGVYELDPNPVNRLDPQFGNLNYRSARGFSQYNALNVSLKSRNLFNTGLQFNTNYTWSHAIDNLSSTFSESSNNNNLGYLDPFNPALDKGSADFDVRHRFVASGVWDLPWMKNAQNTFVRQSLSGWSVSPIFTAWTGTPYTVFDCTNEAFARCPRMFTTGVTSINGSAGSSTLVGPNLYNWFTLPPNAFPVGTSYADPITGTGEFPTCTGALGQGCKWPSTMTGRNMFRGPGAWNTNLGIYKHLKLTERVGMQLRGEAYNLFNHPNFSLLGANNDISAFGPGQTPVMQVKKVGNRDMQLAVKFLF